jgi:hypothetical protein
MGFGFFLVVVGALALAAGHGDPVAGIAGGILIGVGLGRCTNRERP